MKGKAKKCEMRDISGTIIIPISSLYHPWLIWGVPNVLHPCIIPGPFFIAHAAGVVIAKIIKKTETRIEIVYSLT